jgi:hypothetical protein
MGAWCQAVASGGGMTWEKEKLEIQREDMWREKEERVLKDKFMDLVFRTESFEILEVKEF